LKVLFFHGPQEIGRREDVYRWAHTTHDARRAPCDDLSDALKGLFVGAIIWEAADRAEKAKEKELCPFLKRLAASESFVQAHALYEFYNPKKTDKPKGKKGETAHASHFGEWTEKEFTSDELKLFERYIRGHEVTGVFRTNSPVNKRGSHLAYDRSDFSGGSGQDAPII
jgi:hypothetical protein